jgi:hypothetical protein
MNTMPCILARQHVNNDLSQTRDLDFPLSSSCKKVQKELPQTENMDTTSVYTGNNKWLVPYIK